MVKKIQGPEEMADKSLGLTSVFQARIGTDCELILCAAASAFIHYGATQSERPALPALGRALSPKAPLSLRTLSNEGDGAASSGYVVFSG